MNTILVSISRDNDTVVRIKELIKNICSLNTNLKSREFVNIIDLSSIEWITPLSILPLAFLINKFKNKIQNIYYPQNKKTKSYLDIISFPVGTDNLQFVSRLDTYLPIIKVEHNNEKIPAEVLEVVNEKYHDLLKSLLKNQIYRTDLHTALGIFLQEIIDNVEQHSYARQFWLFSQYWEKLEELEICLLDDGIGFYESYRRANIKAESHLEAIENAVVKGISTKDIKERATGLRSSIRLITESPLNGEFLIISGNALYYKKMKQQGKLVSVNDNEFIWNGVIIMVKIRKPYSQILYWKYIDYY